MKVKDLIQEIEDCKADYPDFLEWDVYTEQITEADKQSKKNNPQWKWLQDSEDWEYLECAGYSTKFSQEKVFTVNVNY